MQAIHKMTGFRDNRCPGGGCGVDVDPTEEKIIRFNLPWNFSHLSQQVCIYDLNETGFLPPPRSELPLSILREERFLLFSAYS